MKALVFDGHGDLDVMKITDLPEPEPGKHQLLVRVEAAGVNRADVLQRKGLYPPPPGESDIPGLEIAGEVVALGEGVTGWNLGSRVFGLVAGGGYARYCLLHQDLAMAIPDGWDYVRAAAVPEVYYTAGETLFHLGGLTGGEIALIHAGGSGVGSAGIQMAAATGVRVLTTAGSEEKLQRCRALGADVGINYHQQDFLGAVQQETDGQGVHLVQDFIGAAYLNRNLKALRKDGRLIVVGLLGGAKAELNLGLVLTRRLKIIGSVMRLRTLAEKAEIRRRFEQRWLPLLLEGKLKPVIHATIPFEEAKRAHAMMEASSHFGKIILSF